MATKAKPKVKSTKATSKSRSRKSTATKSSQFPQAFVANGRFAPGTEVGFWPANEVDVERAAGQAPFPKATKTVKVAKDGSVAVAGLEPGTYVAASETGDDGRWTYVQFSVKADG